MNNRSYEALLYGITANVVSKIMEINNWDEDTALERFTESKLYTFLENEETKVWQYSSLMLAQLFNDERSGSIVFPEV